MTRRPASIAAVALAFAVAAAGGGCGGDDQEVHGVDTDDPRAVAEAVKRAVYNCGEDGAGLLWDLRLPSQNRVSRQQALQNSQERGCRPEAPPRFDVIETARQGDQVGFEITSTDPESGRSQREEVVVVQTDDGYRFDGEQTEVERDPSDL